MEPSMESRHLHPAHAFRERPQVGLGESMNRISDPGRRRCDAAGCTARGPRSLIFDQQSAGGFECLAEECGSSFLSAVSVDRARVFRAVTTRSAPPGEDVCRRHDREKPDCARYSYLRATIGSTFIARRAGK